MTLLDYDLSKTHLLDRYAVENQTIYDVDLCSLNHLSMLNFTLGADRAKYRSVSMDCIQYWLSLDRAYPWNTYVMLSSEDPHDLAALHDSLRVENLLFERFCPLPEELPPALVFLAPRYEHTTIKNRHERLCEKIMDPLAQKLLSLTPLTHAQATNCIQEYGTASGLVWKQQHWGTYHLNSAQVVERSSHHLILHLETLGGAPLAWLDAVEQAGITVYSVSVPTLGAAEEEYASAEPQYHHDLETEAAFFFSVEVKPLAQVETSAAARKQGLCPWQYVVQVL